MTTKAAAVITVRRAASMTPRGRKAVAAWMRKQAGFLEKYAKELSPLFQARYLYDPHA